MFEPPVEPTPTHPGAGGRVGLPEVRAPFGALASRPQGRLVAERMVALAAVLAAVPLPHRSGAGAGSASAGASADSPRPHGVEGVDPGPTLAGLLDDTDLATVDDHELVDVIAGWQRQTGHGEARQLEAIAALARRPMFAGCAEHGHGDPQHGVRGAASEISAALRLSPAAAMTRAVLACELAEELPATLAELKAGRIDGYRARVLAEQTRPLADTPALRRRVEAGLLAKASRQTATQLRAAARSAVLAADPASAEDRSRRARAGRFLSAPSPEPDGMASMLLRLPAEDAVAFWTAVDAAARHQHTNPANAADPANQPTLDQLRADIVASLGWSALEAGHLGCCHPTCGHVNQRLGGRHGRAATVNVTVGITTLLGVDDQPAELAGYGPIPAVMARQIAANPDSVWRRLLTDPASGAVLDVGHTRYQPPPELAEHIIVRDRTCRFPTCTRPAAGCDLDHTEPYRRGGATSAGNLGPLHRGHHNDKTHHHWRLEQPEPGRFIWTSPTGHCYPVEPEIVGLLAQPPPAAIGEPGEPVDHDPPPF